MAPSPLTTTLNPTPRGGGIENLISSQKFFKLNTFDLSLVFMYYMVRPSMLYVSILGFVVTVNVVYIVEVVFIF